MASKHMRKDLTLISMNQNKNHKCYFIHIKMTNLHSWRSSSAVRSLGYSCRGVRLESLCPQEDTILTPVSRDLMPSRLFNPNPIWYTDMTYSVKTYIFSIFKMESVAADLGFSGRNLRSLAVP